MKITFFKTPVGNIIATQSADTLQGETQEKLCWLYGGAQVENEEKMAEHKGYAAERKPFMALRNQKNITQPAGQKCQDQKDTPLL